MQHGQRLLGQPDIRSYLHFILQMHMHVADIQRDLGSWLQSLPADGTW